MNNTSEKNSGGTIFLENTAYTYIENAQILKNKAMNGGGLMVFILIKNL